MTRIDAGPGRQATGWRARGSAWLASPRRVLGTLARLVVLWWAGLTWGVPLLIRLVHRTDLPLLGRLMSARETQPLETYLALWPPVARPLIVLGLTSALVLAALYLLHWYKRQSLAARPHHEIARASSGQLLLVAAWTGLAVGLGEAYYLVLRTSYLNMPVPRFLNASQHAVWMSPLASLVVFLFAGLALVLVNRLAGHRVAPGTIITAMAGLGLFGLIMATHRLHWAAALVLTAGLAVQLRRIVPPGGGDVVRLARRTIGWMVAIVIGLGIGVRVGELLRERRQASEASAAVVDAGAPNVLLIVLDTERAMSTSLHGAVRPTTPFLEAIATRGVQFELAIAPTSWTVPSHAAMFTGRPTRELGLQWDTPLDDRFPTIAEALSRHGYATAGFVGNQFFVSDLFGLDRGFGRWEDQPILPGTILQHSWIGRNLVTEVRQRFGNRQDLGRKTADHVNAAFLGWIDQREHRPFLAFLNYFDAHAPYLPPEPWNLRFSTTQPKYWVGSRDPADYTLAERVELETAYEASIAYLDDRLERLFAELDGRGLLSETLIIVTSDHGEAFGEGDQMEHQEDLVLSQIHVPLVMMLPGTIPAGTKIPEPVELRHLAATVLDITRVPAGGIPGASLARYWSAEGPDPVDTVAVAHDGSMASIVTPTHHLLRYRDGRERLFAYRQDPREQADLAGDPAMAELLATLRETLRSRLFLDW